jgi:hypothetical protein
MSRSPGQSGRNTDGMEWRLPGESEGLDPMEIGPKLKPPR